MGCSGSPGAYDSVLMNASMSIVKRRYLLNKRAEQKKMLCSSADYYDLLFIYCGPDTGRALPPELCMLCLELAGLCGRGRTQTFFWVYC